MWNESSLSLEQMIGFFSSAFLESLQLETSLQLQITYVRVYVCVCACLCTVFDYTIILENLQNYGKP